MIRQLTNDPHGECIIDRENEGSKEHPIQWQHVDYLKTIWELERAIFDILDQDPDYKLISYSHILETRSINWSMHPWKRLTFLRWMAKVSQPYLSVPFAPSVFVMGLF